MYEYGYYANSEDLQLLLNRFDKNKDGKITHTEVRSIVSFVNVILSSQKN